MLLECVLLFLFAGVPYYVYFEKTKQLQHEKIFFLSSFLVIVGIVISNRYPHAVSMPLVVIAFIASLYSLYKAEKTRNLYKLSYYILFFNAPMFIMFDTKQSSYYATALLFTLFGIYLMARYDEKNYGSANYQSITGITLVTPYAGLFLTIYLTALALYPPFPNSLFFFHTILLGDTNMMWYFIVVVIFFGNFLIAMRVMAKTVFGKPNEHVHYIDLNQKEIWVHLGMLAILLVLSMLGLQEVLS